ncbi:MAG: mechanosensitive ion channel family protein, partial [Victivallales bacterium]|nr:mechanosensitive ion channel family protein [Victivallales bacterium]
MSEEIVKSEEVVKETAAKTQQLIQQIKAGEGGSVWRELWNTYQGSLIHIGKIILLAILILVIAYFICKAMRGLIGKLSTKYSIDISISGIIKRTLTVVIYSFAALIILDLLGINTASVLTVLGAAGLAIGLALKDTLSNIAAGIFLLTQHPYKTGDFVECAGMSGSILTIGLFTTKLRTPQGQDIFVPNNSIITSPITNYSSNKTRRADITVGISYGDNLEEGIKIL